MIRENQIEQLVKGVRRNCDISDARDHGVYSMCSMILKLRNLYKWEHHIQPWTEPEPADLLDWIDGKETYWETIAHESFQSLFLAEKEIAPHDLGQVNRLLGAETLLYGAGHGRSMKAVFFLADILEKRLVDGCQVYILGKEYAKEMASPVALVQDNLIIIRRESLRYFLWDQVQELRSSCRKSFQQVLEHYHLQKDGTFDHDSFKATLDTMVDEELDLFIYHEIGETLETSFDQVTFQSVISRFPSSVIEFICRAVKDLLADTHPRGVLSHIISEKKDSTLGLYLGFLDGLREKLFPEIKENWHYYHDSNDWSFIEEARRSCHEKNLELALDIKEIAQMIGLHSDKQVMEQFTSRVILPLGLEAPKEQLGSSRA